ncbi:MAG: hypothetical protein WBA69_07705, partial [Mycobacterium sp.]
MNFGQFDVVEPLAPLAAGVPGAAAGSGVPWFPAAADVVPSEPVPAVPVVPVASVVDAPGASAGSGVPELPAA